ncbi:hypothetical protein [Streptomyces sp. NBC_01431]|uniref:hypothetical protein n=1 Tax=Streptomyces sp. NBC_01431 TaxID=2903863 RepID=UPI002E3612CD|nr:hypothetical protein [Streptomyces sp. NBC_01431]
MESDLQQGADVVVAGAEVCVIALVEPIEVLTWRPNVGIPAAVRVCDLACGEALPSFEDGDLSVLGDG